MDKTINNIYKDYMKILKEYIGNDTTYNDDLERKGKKIFGSRFLGVFSSDKLPTNIKSREMYIANLDKSNESGSHWIAVYKKNNKLYVYDSFGRKSKKIIPSIYRKKGASIKIKDTQYDAEQHKKEENCGLRSMVALYMFDHHEPELISKYL